MENENRHHPAAPAVITGLALMILVGSYLVLADYRSWWPYSTGSKVTVSPTPTASVDPTAGWKTYTSQGVNISFKYPSDWTVKEWNNYPGSAQGNDELRITKGSDTIYTSVKRDCLEGSTYCKAVYDAQYPQGWPSFSTLSTRLEVQQIIDRIVSSTVRLR